MIGVDVMLDKGTRFYKTLYFRIPLHFDFEYGDWVADYEDMNKLGEEVKKKMPFLNYTDFSLAATF